MVSPSIVIVNPKDNVGVAMQAIEEGSLAYEDARALDDIQLGHKIAIKDLAPGENVIKFGVIIGAAKCGIKKGEHVHTHNAKWTQPAARRGKAASKLESPSDNLLGRIDAELKLTPTVGGTFATRQYIGILCTVNCAVSVGRIVSQMFQSESLPDWCDGVVALDCKTGCGMDTESYGFEILQRTVLGYANHSNFRHVFVLGLGCEMNTTRSLEVRLQDAGRTSGNISFVNIQEQGGVKETIKHLQGKISELFNLDAVPRVARADLKDLVIGLQCGGSDAFSALTANPLLGKAIDLLVAKGASALLSETPELIGARDALLQRVSSPEIAKKFVDRLEWWDEYCSQHNVTFDNNPSPGNLAGGITTITEKSIGAAAKGGSGEIQGILEYAQPLECSGLNIMDSPGYDPVSVTGQIASGANLIVFTTGRGSVYGSVPVPTVKMATNNTSYNRQKDDFDFNAGTLVDKPGEFEEQAIALANHIICVASGQKTSSEEYFFGEAEFLPWPMGAVM